MSYQLDGDWPVRERTAGCRHVSAARVAPGWHTVASIAAGTLAAMGHLAAKWHKASMTMDKAYSERLEPTAVEQLRAIIRHLDDLSVLLLMPPDAVVRYGRLPSARARATCTAL